MILKKLKNEFFLDNPNLIQALHDKNRGYGIVVIEFNQLKFGIPLHSNINPKYGFETVKTQILKEDGKKMMKSKGLDFHKALLLESDHYLDRSFKISATEFNLIVDHQQEIQRRFEQYVLKYRQLYLTGKLAQLKREYAFSTLVNYHWVLELDSTQLSDVE